MIQARKGLGPPLRHFAPSQASTNVLARCHGLAGDHSNQAALGALTAFGIVMAVALPPGLAVWLRRRRGQARG